MKKTLLTIAALVCTLLASAQATVTPEGTPKVYEMTYSYDLSGYVTNYQSLEVKVCTSADGKTIYISNLFPTYTYAQKDVWVKGTIEGTIVTIPAQSIYTKEASTGTTTIYVGCADADNNLSDCTMTLSDDGTLTMNSANLSYIEDYSYGTTYSSRNNRYQVTDVELRPVTLPMEVVKVPSTAIRQNATYQYYTSVSKTVVDSIAFDGDDVYLHGLNATPNLSIPKSTISAWIKGTYDKTTHKLTIPKGQYIGAGSGMVLFNYPAMVDAEGSIQGYVDAVFTYDSASQTLTMDEQDGLVAAFCTTNAQQSPMGYILGPSIVIAYDLDGKGTGETPTPSAPYDVRYTEKAASTNKLGSNAWPFFVFFIQPTSAEGKPLDTSKLYYRLYLDGDTLTDFTSYGLGEMKLFPYQYHDLSYTFFTSSTATTGSTAYLNQVRLMSVDAASFKSLGVQTIYQDGTTTKESEIVTVENPNPSGIENLSISHNEECAGSIYNLAGQRVKATQHGIYIINGNKVIR